jgi:hypothetical protein
MLAFFLGSAAVVLPRWLVIVGGSLLAGGAVIAIVKSPDLIQLGAELFRVQSSLGYRGIAWSATVSEFGFSDWLIGTGLASWPVFFEKYAGVPLADPHSWLLSIPGTFGLPGILYYTLVFITLAGAWKSAKDERGCRVAITLLILLVFVRDLVAVPVLLGNTPLAFLVWLAMAIALSGRLRMHAGSRSRGEGGI